MTNMQMVEAVKQLAADLDELIWATNKELNEMEGYEAVAGVRGELRALMNIRASLPDYFEGVA